MKELTKYSRVAGYLNRLFDLLNQDFFDGELERPVITIQSTPRAYGHFTLYDAWDVNGAGAKELNIGAGTLNRPIEYVVTTLLHEMVHQYHCEHNVQDTSRKGTYHNRVFAREAARRGLCVSRSETYGWSITTPSEQLLDWCLLKDLPEIRLNRNEPCGVACSTPKAESHSRRYLCPCCSQLVRATKAVNIMCGNCHTTMVER